MTAIINNSWLGNYNGTSRIDDSACLVGAFGFSDLKTRKIYAKAMPCCDMGGGGGLRQPTTLLAIYVTK